jgi:hypothetical protein
MVTTIPTRSVRTIYRGIGDVFAYLCVAGFVFMGALAVARRVKPPKVVEEQAG